MLNGLAQRHLYFIVSALCALLLVSAYYFQYVDGLEPCPLCITQRFFVLLVGLVAFAAAGHNPVRASIARLYSLVILLCALGGAFFAGRMVWIQHLPAEQVPSCGPSLEYMLNSFPFMDALKLLLRGNGDCAQVSWSLLGLSMPAWVLAWFVVFALVALFGLFKAGK